MHIVHSKKQQLNNAMILANLERIREDLLNPAQLAARANTGVLELAVRGRGSCQEP